MADHNPRQERILELVHQRGFVSIESLASLFEVTAQTIRRDINDLCEQGLLLRFHGGAGLPSSVENVAYDTRQILMLEEKRRIAALTARHVPDHASLFINVGTTTEEVARALLEHQSLRIITNNLNVANILSGNPDFEVIVAGGLVRNRDRAIVGETAIDLINQFVVDIAIIGISGIDSDGTLLDYDYREVRVAQAIMKNARKVYLVADHSKFSRNPMVKLGHVSQIDAFFTDRPVPHELASIFADGGVIVHASPSPVESVSA